MLAAPQSSEREKLNQYLQGLHAHLATHPEAKNAVTAMAFSHAYGLDLTNEEFESALDEQCTADTILAARAARPAVAAQSTARRKATPEEIQSLKKMIGNVLRYIPETAIMYQVPSSRLPILFSKASSAIENDTQYLSIPTKRMLQMLISYLTLTLLSPQTYMVTTLLKIGNDIFSPFLGEKTFKTLVANAAVCLSVMNSTHEYSPYNAIQRFLDEYVPQYGYAAYLIAPACTLAIETARPIARPLLFSVASRIGSAVSSLPRYWSAFVEASSDFSDAIHGQGPYYDKPAL